MGNKASIPSEDMHLIDLITKYTKEDFDLPEDVREDVVLMYKNNPQLARELRSSLIAYYKSQGRRKAYSSWFSFLPQGGIGQGPIGKMMVKHYYKYKGVNLYICCGEEMLRKERQKLSALTIDSPLLSLVKKFVTEDFDGTLERRDAVLEMFKDNPQWGYKLNVLLVRYYKRKGKQHLKVFEASDQERKVQLQKAITELYEQYICPNSLQESRGMKNVDDFSGDTPRQGRQAVSVYEKAAV